VSCRELKAVEKANLSQGGTQSHGTRLVSRAAEKAIKA
jgi:hypothetical protein